MAIIFSAAVVILLHTILFIILNIESMINDVKSLYHLQILNAYFCCAATLLKP